MSDNETPSRIDTVLETDYGYKIFEGTPDQVRKFLERNASIHMYRVAIGGTFEVMSALTYQKLVN